MIDPTDLEMLIDYFHDALVKELQPTAAIVDKKGARVLRVRFAIVNLVPTLAATSLVATAIPYGLVAEVGAGAATSRPLGSAPYLGETEIEAQFLDGVTGLVVAEFTDNMVGRKYVVELEEGVTDAAQK